MSLYVPNNKKVSKTLSMTVLWNKIKNEVCVCLDLLVAIENFIFIGLWASIYIFLSEKNIYSGSTTLQAYVCAYSIYHILNLFVSLEFP